MADPVDGDWSVQGKVSATMVTLEGSDASKLLTQSLRFVSHGLMEDIFASTVVEGPDGQREALTAAQFEVLRYIDRHERPTVKNVADALHISSAAATKAVRGLSEDRQVPLVRRARGTDRRTVRLATTAAGHEVVRQVRGTYTASLEDVMGRMAPSDREALHRGLRGFLEAALVGEAACEAACLRCGIDHVETCVVHQQQHRGTDLVVVNC